MTTHRFNNTASQREKVQMLKQDRALLDLHAVAKPAQSAKDPATLWPRLPEGSPWSGPQVPIEPALGYSVDAPQARRRR